MKTNIFLIKMIGINGAAIGNIICNFIVVLIGGIVLNSVCKIKFDFKNYFFKVFLAILLMTVISLYTYVYLERIIYAKLATIVAIGVAVSVYVLAVISLKILPIFGIKERQKK